MRKEIIPDMKYSQKNIQNWEMKGLVQGTCCLLHYISLQGKHDNDGRSKAGRSSPDQLSCNYFLLLLPLSWMAITSQAIKNEQNMNFPPHPRVIMGSNGSFLQEFQGSYFIMTFLWSAYLEWLIKGDFKNQNFCFADHAKGLLWVDLHNRDS